MDCSPAHLILQLSNSGKQEAPILQALLQENKDIVMDVEGGMGEYYLRYIYSISAVSITMDGGHGTSTDSGTPAL